MSARVANPVALVLDPRFGDRLADVARTMPTWVCDSPANGLVAQQLWSERARCGITDVLPDAPCVNWQ